MGNIEQMQNFFKGVQTQAQMLLDASTEGTIRTLTEPQVKELIEKMSLNKNNFVNKIDFKNIETKSRSHSELALKGYEEFHKKL